MNYSDEHKRLIVEYSHLPNQELAKKFFEVFKVQLSDAQIRGLRSRLGANRYKRKEFTEEMDLFLKKYAHMRVSDVAEKFNAEFKTDYSNDVILYRLYRNGFKSKRKTHIWKDDEIRFILDNIDLNRDELMRKVNNRFGINVSKNAIEKYLSRNNFIHDKTITFTEEEISYISKKFPTMKTEELVDLFSEKFKKNITAHKLRTYANNSLGIKKDTNSTKEHFEVGHESIRCGRIYITVERGKRKVPKNRFIYEKSTGKSAERKKVMHLDGNPLNCDPDNLYALDNVALWTLIGNNMMFKENRELTLTAIKYAELMSKLKQERED